MPEPNVNLGLRLPADLYEPLKRVAERDQMSLNAWIVRVIQKAVKK